MKKHYYRAVMVLMVAKDGTPTVVRDACVFHTMEQPDGEGDLIDIRDALELHAITHVQTYLSYSPAAPVNYPYFVKTSGVLLPVLSGDDKPTYHVNPERQSLSYP